MNNAKQNSMARAFVVNRDVRLTVLDHVNRRIASALVKLDANGIATAPQVVMPGPGTVRVSVIDVLGAPKAGIAVGVSDAYSRAVGLAPTMRTTDGSGQITIPDVPAGTVAAVTQATGYAS